MSKRFSLILIGISRKPSYITSKEGIFENSLQFIKRAATEPSVGNRWFKANLHVHAQSCDPRDLVRLARQHEIDFIAITDHQSFASVASVREEVAATPGRPLTVLTGMEVTALEGVHLLVLFPEHYSEEWCKKMLGYLELSGSGSTAEASRRTVADILAKTEEEGRIVVAPHLFANKTGLLDSSRKMSTKKEWLESGHIRLVQAPGDKIRYIDWDETGQWVNRYVLASANAEQVRESTYSLAPINISDCYSAEDVDSGCSWFLMGEISIEGLKQVTCEPAARLRKTSPQQDLHDAILAVQVTGGYCDGQSFNFSQGLTCVVGQNHAGKSAVFDFIRFALGTDDRGQAEAQTKLFSRLSAILGVGGQVELIVRRDRSLYLLRRSFRDLKEPGKYFRFDPDPGVLTPVEPFRFQVEVYEQGRIQKLRDDVNRQLDMLDEFAGLQPLRQEQEQLIEKLNESATEIAPLRFRQGKLAVDLAELPALESELNAKEALLPHEENERPWKSSAATANNLRSVVADLASLSDRIERPQNSFGEEDDDPIWLLFNQNLPQVDPESLSQPELFRQWLRTVVAALSEFSTTRTKILALARNLREQSDSFESEWETIRNLHEQETSRDLAEAGVDSPQDLLDRVTELRNHIQQLRNVKLSQLEQTTKDLGIKEAARVTMLSKLREIDRQVREARVAKAVDLTGTFGGQIEISLKPFGDRAAYKLLLTTLYDRISSREQQIKNIDTQLSLVADKFTPLDLAEALLNKGVATLEDGTNAEITAISGITPHTQSVLCTLANDINLLNRLQTARTPDILQIRVKRQGESVFADLTTELSQGEQSAALLTLTLQSRTVPLILDQPEDELGYNYVVNLIVPKVLRAKFSRQLLIITHNANIPVLGDADYVVKMENRPRPSGGRQCLVAGQGCFELPSITATLMELEGGRRAFEFRRHRYSLSSVSV